MLHPRPKSGFPSVFFSRGSLYTIWRSGFCGTCCFPCQSYQNAERMGKSGILYGLLGWVIPFVPPLIMRGDLRDQNNIQGSTFNDAVAAFCCTCCASIQIANELDSRQGKHFKGSAIVLLYCTLKCSVFLALGLPYIFIEFGISVQCSWSGIFKIQLCLNFPLQEHWTEMPNSMKM